MRQLNKAHFISDIHGYVEGLELADKICTQEEPLYILGDLFDHKYGDEKRIVDLILKMIDEQRCYLIMGNHDEVLFLILFRYLDDETILRQFANPGFSVITNVLTGLFDQTFLKEEEKLRAELLIDKQVDVYYQKIETLCHKPQYASMYTKLEALFKKIKRSDSVLIGDQKFLLTHSGNKEIPYLLDILTTEYKVDEDIDYVIMGHITKPYIENTLIEYESSLKLSNFRDEVEVPKVNISGTYVFNTYNKAIMIDDGSHVNVVTITT